jgi:hypothetical protein
MWLVRASMLATIHSSGTSPSSEVSGSQGFLAFLILTFLSERILDNSFLAASPTGFLSRQSSVRRPEQATARTDWRKRLRILGTLARRSRLASTRLKSSSILVTMRFYSGRGGKRMGMRLISDCVSLSRVVPVTKSEKSAKSNRCLRKPFEVNFTRARKT